MVKWEGLIEQLLSGKNTHTILFELHALKSSTQPKMTEHL